MAADNSCWIGDSEVTRIKKIFRVKHGLAGMAGDVNGIAAFIEWLRDGAEEEDYPIGGYEAIVVDPKGRVTLWEGSGYCPVPLKGSYCAIGAGTDYALGALYAGASAPVAVRAAIRHNAKCRGPVSIYRLSGRIKGAQAAGFSEPIDISTTLPFNSAISFR